jgi:hyperosmotically inducible periplasmic protein
MKKYLALTALIATLSLSAMQAFGDVKDKGTPKDAWITGKLEATYALNRHLSPLTINTETTNGVVHLTGNVESDIDRDLAGELAKGIEGVVSVDNDLAIKPNARHDAHTASSTTRPFGVFVDDATTTAMVKTKLLANPNIKGLDIDVDTRGDVVTLSGQVASNEQKQLAEELARNTGDVKEVHNQLVVKRAG